jgi:hypothetical protein
MVADGRQNCSCHRSLPPIDVQILRPDPPGNCEREVASAAIFSPGGRLFPGRWFYQGVQTYSYYPAPGVCIASRCRKLVRGMRRMRGKSPGLPCRANGDRALMRIGVDYTRAKSSFFGASAGPQTDSSALGRSQPSRWSICHCRLSILRTGFSSRMAKAIVGLPRISCRPCWRWRTPAASL